MIVPLTTKKEEGRPHAGLFEKDAPLFYVDEGHESVGVYQL
jgi:hypothetical protein